jgi:hypothetical protein
MQQPLEDRRIVLVDDMDVNLAGRRFWLEEAGCRDVVTLDFPHALTYKDWPSVHTLIVDGLDETEDADRDRWVAELSHGDPLFPLDYFMGVRVVRAARAMNPQLVITVMSSFVDRSPAMVSRFHQSGANYIYSHKAAHGRTDFLTAVRNPGTGRGHVAVRRHSTRTNVEEVLDVLGGGRSKWHPKVVEAVRRVLVDGEDRKEVLARTSLSVRQFNDLMDYIKDLMGLAYSTGNIDDRKPRLERVRDFLTKKVLGWELVRHDRDIERP